ncbi:MAG: ABC transporter ATP-binding protein [Planctomycetota bacterium]
MIIAKNVTRTYTGGSESVVALNDLSIAIDAGERVALLGRSGSGKTTLLNLLAGLDRPTTGSLEVAGRSLEMLGGRQMADYRLESIGVVFQSFQLIPQRSALQNVALPLILAGVPHAKRLTMAEQALRRVGLGSRMKHQPFQLSGGEQQRVAIARAIVNEPPVILADEPTGNLDSTTSGEVMELLLEVVADNKATLVLVTHDRELANGFSTRIIELADGRLVCGDES